MKFILTSDTHYGMDGKTHSKHEKFWRNIKKEIEANDVKALIWAGDLSANKQRQFSRSIEQARHHIKIPILLVRGNHDFWDAVDAIDKNAYKRSFGLLQNLHAEIFKKYDISHLENGPVVIKDVIIAGWDGWYGISNPPTNDDVNMFNDHEGCPMHVFMSNRAWKKFEEVLNLDVSNYRKSIAVTHFNPYVTDRKWADMCANNKFYDLIKEKYDVFCCGHNHQFKDRIEDGCRVLNSGSDYNNPKYIVFEV